MRSGKLAVRMTISLFPSIFAFLFAIFAFFAISGPPGSRNDFAFPRYLKRSRNKKQISRNKKQRSRNKKQISRNKNQFEGKINLYNAYNTG